MESVNVAVIGVGNMGFAHACRIYDNQIRGLRLSAVCDIEKPRLDAAGARLRGVACFLDHHALLSAQVADAVVIAVPHRLHACIAMEALKKGCHVLVEKPMDVTLSRAQALWDAAKGSGRVFAIMFNQRTNPLYRALRDFVKGGQLGTLKRSSWTITNWYRTQYYYDSGAWRATWGGEGGGVLLNQAPHNLDLWQWICGMPTSITAFCETAKYHHIEVEDEATLFTRYENGATGTFITSTGEYPGTNRLEVAGTRGKVVLENGVLKRWLLKKDEQAVRFNSDKNMDAIAFEYDEVVPNAPETAHAGILQGFADAILHGAPLLSPGGDGLSELTLSNAAYLSQWLGNKEIMLPFDAALFDKMLEERAAKSSYKAQREMQLPDGEYGERWQVRW